MCACVRISPEFAPAPARAGLPVPISHRKKGGALAHLCKCHRVTSRAALAARSRAYIGERPCVGVPYGLVYFLGTCIRVSRDRRAVYSRSRARERCLNVIMPGQRGGFVDALLWTHLNGVRVCIIVQYRCGFAVNTHAFRNEVIHNVHKRCE